MLDSATLLIFACAFHFRLWPHVWSPADEPATIISITLSNNPVEISAVNGICPKIKQRPKTGNTKVRFFLQK